MLHPTFCFYFRVQGGAGKGCTTVLLTISANGSCLPPYIIFKALRLYAHWCPKNIIKGAVFNGTKSGWSDDTCFYDYLENLFIPNTKHLKPPILLLFDGHYSHLSLKSVRLAMQHNIHLLCLPSHTTHLLQPLDVYTLKYVKQQWKDLLWERNKKSTETMDKCEFVNTFSKLYDFALIPAHCSTAFAKAGVYPFDKRVVKSDRIIKSKSSSTEVKPQSTSEASVVLLNTSVNLSTQSSTRRTLARSNSTPEMTSREY